MSCKIHAKAEGLTRLVIERSGGEGNHAGAPVAHGGWTGGGEGNERTEQKQHEKKGMQQQQRRSLA